MRLVQTLLKLQILLMAAKATFGHFTKLGSKNMPLAQFYSNLIRVESFQTTLIAMSDDFKKDKELKSLLVNAQEDSETGIATFDFVSLMTEVGKKPDDDCPVMVPYGNVSATHKNTLYRREIKAFPAQKTPRLLIFWTDGDLTESDIYSLVSQVALNCTQAIDYGPFNENSIIMILSQKMEVIETVLLHSSAPLLNHPRLLGVLISPFHELVSIWQRVPYNGMQQLQQNFIWSSDNLLDSIDDLIPPLRSFNGEHIIVSTVNFSQPVDKDGFIPRKSWAPAYHHMIAAELETVNAHVSLKPSLTRDIRIVDENGRFLGQSQLIFENMANAAMHSFEDHNNQIGQISPVLLNPGRFTSFIAPNPKQISKNFILVYPYTAQVWIALIVAVVFAAISFMTVSQMQDKICTNCSSIRKKASKQTGPWFVFATLLRNDSSAFHSRMLSTAQGRSLTLLWLLFCLLMSSGYSGNLYSFLANPVYEEPISDVSGILNSGLPWMWYRDSPSMEFLVSQSTDPDLQKLWKGHKPLRRQRGMNLHKVMEPVARGEYILIASSNLKLLVDIIFTPTRGDALVHHPGKPIADFTIANLGWIFPKVSRWGELITKTLRTSVEIGLPSRWAQTSNDGFKIMYTRLYEERGLIMTGMDPTKRDLSFHLSDVQGTFLLWASMTALAATAFLLEKLSKMKKQKKTGNLIHRC